MEDFLFDGLVAATVGLVFGVFIFLPNYIKIKFHKRRAGNGNFNSAQIVGNIYYSGKKFDKAIPYYKVVLNAYPNRFEPVEHLAICYMKTQNYIEAIPLFQRVGIEEPMNANNKFFLGYCYFKLGDTLNALKYQDAAIKLDKKLRKNMYITTE